MWGDSPIAMDFSIRGAVLCRQTVNNASAELAKSRSSSQGADTTPDVEGWCDHETLMSARGTAAVMYFVEKDALCGPSASTVEVKKEKTSTTQDEEPTVGGFKVDLEDENEASILSANMDVDSGSSAPVVEGGDPEPAVAMTTVTPASLGPGLKSIRKGDQPPESLTNKASDRLRASLPTVKEEIGSKRKGDAHASPQRGTSAEKKARVKDVAFQTVSDNMLKTQQSDEDHYSAVKLQEDIDADVPVVPMQGFYPQTGSGAGSSNDYVGSAADVGELPKTTARFSE